jgi:hypothetical protein
MNTTHAIKPKRVYVRVKDRRSGVPVKKRTIGSSDRGNQWIITPKQLKFIELWLEPTSATFGNAYQSAIAAGFSKDYAIKITANSTDVEWIGDARRRLTTFQPEHTVRSIQNLAQNAQQERDRLRALDMLARLQGLYIERVHQQIDVSFTNSVPRPSAIKA